MENGTQSKVKLTDEKSIPEVIRHMTLSEKAALTCGKLAFETHAVERLGIPKLVMADGHNGINIFHLFGNYVPHAMERLGMDPSAARELVVKLRQAGGPAIEALRDGAYESSPLEKLAARHKKLLDAVSEELRRELPAAGLPSCFPTGIVAGASWDPELAAEYGRAVARESLAFGMDIMLGPNVNIHRDPLCGRVFESYSEDPYLAGRIGVGYIQGVQDEGVAAVVKHYAANNQEVERLGGEQKISERALQEIYLPAFKAAVQEGGSWMVMSAYNRINGEACALSRRLLTDILRTEWGFRGFVVSDWGAAYDRVAALQAGNDLEMPGPLQPGPIVMAVHRGELAETDLDERVAAILRITIKLPSFLGKKRPALDRDYSRGVARRLAADGMVLLKNEGGTLPLAGAKLAVFGANTKNPIATGKGSAGVVSPPPVSVLEGLSARFGDDTVAFEGAIDAADVAIVCIGVGSGEGSDRATMALPAADTELVRKVAAECRAKGKRSLVVLNVCAPVEIADWVDEVDAVLHSWMAGMEIGNAVADVVSGVVCPSGKLPLTWPRYYRDTPTSPYFPGEFAETVYGEDIFVGYRYYDTAEVAPLYEFGYGLSYTSFEVSNLELGADTIDLEAGETLTVSVEVANTGACQGKEVVQLYVHDVRSSVQKADKELKGFEKIELAPGQKKSVNFTIGPDDLSHYDTRRGLWCVEPGRFEIQVGTSSRDIRARAEFRAVGLNPYAYGMRTPVARIMGDEKARAVLAKHLPAGAVDDPGVADMVACLPFAEFERAWGGYFTLHLGDRDEQEIAELRDRIVAELAAIEMD